MIKTIFPSGSKDVRCYISYLLCNRKDWKRSKKRKETFLKFKSFAVLLYSKIKAINRFSYASAMTICLHYNSNLISELLLFCTNHVITLIDESSVIFLTFTWFKLSNSHKFWFRISIFLMMSRFWSKVINGECHFCTNCLKVSKSQGSSDQCRRIHFPSNGASKHFRG